MGCNCSRDGTKIIISQKNKGNNQFVLKIHTPDSENVKILFHYSINDRETIINLFNSFFFSNYQEDELDANFISVYNKESDSFEYYIQRLAGYSIENGEIDVEKNRENNKLLLFIITGGFVGIVFLTFIIFFIFIKCCNKETGELIEEEKDYSNIGGIVSGKSEDVSGISDEG